MAGKLRFYQPLWRVATRLWFTRAGGNIASLASKTRHLVFCHTIVHRRHTAQSLPVQSRSSFIICFPGTREGISAGSGRQARAGNRQMATKGREMHLAGVANDGARHWRYSVEGEKKGLLLLFLKIHQLARYEINILRCTKRTLEFTHTHHMLLGYRITIWHHSQV